MKLYINIPSFLMCTFGFWAFFRYPLSEKGFWLGIVFIVAGVIQWMATMVYGKLCDIEEQINTEL